jgi:hypothetical protein
LEQRRAQRYRMQLPLQIVQVGSEKVNRTEQTRDISSGGVCFLSGQDVEVGGRIEYLITLSGSNPPVRIRCLGKVLRSQRQDTAQPPFEVAVTMERYQFMSPQETDAFAAVS